MRWVCILLLIPSLAFAGVHADHFEGVSPPCSSVAAAREKSVHNVVRQILRDMGATYSLSFDSQTTMQGRVVWRRASERFSYAADGFVQEVESAIVSSSCSRTPDGYVCRVLVHFPPSKIEEMRRLSRGAHVVGRFVSSGVELREVNGVRVVFSEYELAVTTVNKRAGFISYYLVKVDPGGTVVVRCALPEPVVVESSAKRVCIDMDTPFNWKSVLLGSTRTIAITFIGRDEVNRPVRVTVRS